MSRDNPERAEIETEPFIVRSDLLASSIDAVLDRADDFAEEVERRNLTDGYGYGSADLMRAFALLQALQEERPIVVEPERRDDARSIVVCLSGEDCQELVDAARERRRLYEATVKHHEGVFVADGRDGDVIADCRDADEARAIAERYRELVARLEAALVRSAGA